MIQHQRLFRPMILILIGVLLCVFGAVQISQASNTPPATPANINHIVPEEPWHPVPAAYLRAVFYLNLRPINWELVEHEYNNLDADGYPFSTFYEAIAPVEEKYGIALSNPIHAAIENQNADAFFTTSTHAIAQLTNYYLDEADSKLENAGAANDDVLKAEQIFRAFNEKFITEVDPDGLRETGLAWLTLSSSIGHAGVGGSGGTAANPSAFSDAKAVIVDYLRANYLVDTFPPRGGYAPIPATIEAIVPHWLPPGSNTNDQNPLPLLRLNFEELGIDEADLPLVAYGDMLFDSPMIFGDPARTFGISCAVCHNRSDINRDFFIPGVSSRAGGADVDGGFFNPLFNDFRNDALDTPSLRGIRFTGPYGRDGRVASLSEFVRNVIVLEFAGAEPTPFMIDALVAYMLEFDFLPSPYLNADGTLNESATDEIRRGETVFQTEYDSMMGGYSCATCHVPSSHFADGQQHNIYGEGTAANAQYFDTPTLLNSVYTAPYMHNGSLDTLADVVTWKNEQFSMNLTEQELADLTAYVIAVGEAEEPYEIFDAENTVFMLAWEELTTFATTLDTLLIPNQDAFHAILLIDTVATDMRLDASALVDLSQAPMVYEVSDKLFEIKAAIEADNWEEAQRLYDEYAALVDEYGSQLR